MNWKLAVKIVLKLISKIVDRHAGAGEAWQIVRETIAVILSALDDAQPATATGESKLTDEDQKDIADALEDLRKNSDESV